MRFLGVNSAGLRSKLFTFKKVLSELKPSVFFVEETKCKDEGKIQLDDYLIFELVRKSRDGGGGLAIGCIKELKPAWVREGDDHVEALSIDIFVKSMKIRCVAAYGCQESDKIERKYAFWKYLEEEVAEAKDVGGGFVLHFDGNLWAGGKIIPGDPRSQNRNGKLFEEFLARNPHLSVVNALPICEGLITRSRKKEGKTERSVLDFFVVCDRVLPFVKRMVIDEQKKYILTNYKNTLANGRACDTDHATEFMDVDLDIIAEKPERKEVFNLKDIEGQKNFKYSTTETDEFSNTFNNNLDVLTQVENWRKILFKHIRKSFKKIRIKKTNLKPFNKSSSKLIDRRNYLINNEPESIEVKLLNTKISEFEAEENRNKIMKEFKTFSDNPEGINLHQMWQRLKKICPKSGTTLPTAKKNHRGRIVSAPGELKKLLAKEYKERLRDRPRRPDLSHLDERRNEIFQRKLKLAEANESREWNMDDVDQALKDLKTNKSRDYEGLINEIFKHPVIGNDLKSSLLTMFNRLKKEKMISEFMNYANITTIPKKGSRLELKNERGIFRVPVPRTILMRMIYNDKYPVIDANMSDCQMGARKNKGCKNNIFIVNGIIHDVLSSKNKKPVLLQIYDYSQMFDSISLKQAISDVFDAGFDDDKLGLVYKANEEINFAVNTPSGLSERQVVKNCVLQGDTWGSILASVQVDSIGQECVEAGYGYMYKEDLPINLLGLVDDLLGVTEAGHQAQQMNTFLNIKSAEKCLQFGSSKCKTMLVGRDTKNIINTELFVDKWEVRHEESESGEEIFVETHVGQVAIEETEEQRYLGFVLSNSGNNMININHMKKKAKGIIRRIFIKLGNLNLQKYYVECAIIFLKVMLRSSILYACETYYNLKENEIRALEMIEEGFLRELFKTGRCCPISQLYAEVGLIPARYEIIKIRLLYLKEILIQKEDSMIFRMFQLQLKQRKRGDWASTCLKNLKELEIEMSLEQIKTMKKSKFKTLLDEKIAPVALTYLKGKQGSKGQEIKFAEIETAEYLLPCSGLLLDDQRKIFSLRNKMVKIVNNFSSIKQACPCGEIDSLQHIYICNLFSENENTEVTPFEEIYSNNISKQVKVLKRFEKVFLKREEIYAQNGRKSEKDKHPPCDLLKDPLFSLLESSNG